MGEIDPPHRERLRARPLPPNAVVVGPLERPDEIDFKEGFDLIELLLVFRS
jgi:hypothetical protein